VEWSELPADKLVFCVGNSAANTAVSLINSAVRCPALTAYDLRWRRNTGQFPDATAPDVELRRPLLSNENDATVPPWPGLKVGLTDRQRRSLRWMLTKEAGTDDELVVERGCQDCRFSTHRGVDFQVRMSYTLRGGILADDMGYGKTLLAISLIAASCVLPMQGRPGCSKLPCSATLIFVPENLVYQWLGEFKKALGEAVDVRFFGTDANGTQRQGSTGNSTGGGSVNRSHEDNHAGTGTRASVSASNAAASPASAAFGSAAGGAAVGAAAGAPDTPARVYAVASIHAWAELMQADWPEALALIIPYSLLRNVEPWYCLHNYHWRRIVVDELHEALACKTVGDALGLISAQHLWGLSGTLPTTMTGEIARVAALFGVSIPIDTTNAGRFLDCYVRRNTADLPQPVPVDDSRYVVRPTPIERAIYLACQHDFDESALVPDAHEGYVPAFLSTWRGLQEHGREAALVKLCCHHQLTETDMELLSTPAHSVERLHTWKRHHCREAKRLVRRHSLLADWMARNCRSAGQSAKARPAISLPEAPRVTVSDREAWTCARTEVEASGRMDDSALLIACSPDLEVMPFAICDQPEEAARRWLEWCEAAGLDTGTPGAISRLRKIMYDELWGRFVDGQEGWNALEKMPGRDWQAEYAAAQLARLRQAIADYAASLRSIAFLECAVQKAASSELECGICLQLLSEPRITPCAHIFCAACIQRSMEAKSECPQCRAPIRGKSQLNVLSTTGGGTQGFEATGLAQRLFRSKGDPEMSEEIGICLQRSSSSSAGPDRAAFNEDTNAPRIVDALCGGTFGSKITALLARLEEIVRIGEKAVVFAQWQDLIFKIHAALAKFGVQAAVLAGSAFDRSSVLQRFEGPELSVLLLSLEDSASGTNMAHANHVLLVHPMVAASAEEQEAYEAQAVGRVRRWGQKRKVNVWRFVMEGTIEADLAARHAAPAVVAAIPSPPHRPATEGSAEGSGEAPG